MAIASQFVRTSIANCARKTCSFATSRLDSFGITPETWYGSPQFAYETYGPRSTMRISAFSSSRRRRAAHDAPPATPPTMMTFMIVSCGVFVHDGAILVVDRVQLTRVPSAHELDGGQQVGRDRALEHEGVGAGFHRRPAYALLVVDAEDDHLEVGTALPHRSQPAQAAVPGQGEIHDRHVGPKSARSLEQRRLVGDHDHRSERRLEQPAHAFRETVVAVRQQDAAQRLLGH